MATDIRNAADPSMTELVTGIVHDAQDLIKQQIALLKHEIKEDIRTSKEAALTMSLGLATLLMGGLLVSLMCVYLLQWAWPALDVWACFGICGALLLGFGGILFYTGKKKLDSLSAVPEQSAKALKENVKWIMNQK